MPIKRQKGDYPFSFIDPAYEPVSKEQIAQMIQGINTRNREFWDNRQAQQELPRRGQGHLSFPEVGNRGFDNRTPPINSGSVVSVVRGGMDDSAFRDAVLEAISTRRQQKETEEKFSRRTLPPLTHESNQTGEQKTTPLKKLKRSIEF